jgi:hypothetical protein
LAAENNREFQEFQFRKDGLDDFVEFVIIDQKAGLDILKNLQQLFFSEKVIDGHENGTGFGAGEIDLEKFGAVVKENGNPVSLLETHLQQAVRKAIDALIQFAIIYPPVFKDQRWLVRIIERASSKDISNTHFDRLLKVPNQ